MLAPKPQSSHELMLLYSAVSTCPYPVLSRWPAPDHLGAIHARTIDTDPSIVRSLFRAAGLSPASRPSRRCESVARLTSCRGICSIRAVRRLGLLLRHRKFRQMPLGLCEAQSDLLISSGSETADPYHILWQGFPRPLQLRLLHFACAALPSRPHFCSWHHTQRRIAGSLFDGAVSRHERPLPWTHDICSRPACNALFCRWLGCGWHAGFRGEPQGEISTSWVTLQVPFNLDWWGIPYAPQSFTTNLYYAPQHFFGALIGTALLYASLQSSQPASATLIETVIVIAASVFWSPYVAVGLAALPSCWL